jgi:hypothetical protein
VYISGVWNIFHFYYTTPTYPVNSFSYSCFSLLFYHFSILNLRKQKGEKITIWERNFQLAFYSILLLCIVLVYEIQVADVAVGAVVPQMFFKGWTINTVMISLIQAVRMYVCMV